MKKKFRTDATYLIGRPKLIESQHRSEPVFEEKGTVNISGQLLKNMGISTTDDLAVRAIQPLLKLGKMYWVYEVMPDATLQYFGEFTPIARMQTTPAVVVPSSAYSSQVEQQAGSTTSLSDAMTSVHQGEAPAWRAKYEAAEERIQTLQDSFDALRDERESEGERITSLITTQSDEQNKLMRSQLDSANGQVERLYKIISEKDRQIFQLQQDVLEVQMKLHQQKIKADYVRDFDRATKEFQRQAESSNGPGLNDLLQVAMQALPLLLADKGVSPQPSLSDNASKQSAPRANANAYSGLPTPAPHGAIEQPARDMQSTYIPPRPTEMSPPRRILMPEEQEAEVQEMDQTEAQSTY